MSRVVSSPGRLVATLAALAALCSGLLACGAPPPDGGSALGAFPYGTVVSRQDVLVVPDRNWSWRAGRQGGDSAFSEAWLFRSGASLLFQLRENSPQALTVRLEPEGATAQHRFRVEWDGKVLAEDLEGSRLEIRLEPAHLTAGRHALELVRVHNRAGQPHDNTFLALHVEPEAGPVQRLDPAHLGRYQLVADLLEVGVAGAGHEKFGGVLFAGPASLATRLESAGPAFLHLRAQNHSTAPARFTVALGGREQQLPVEAGGEQVLRWPVEAGRHSLRLAAEGEEGGVFFWAEPYLEAREESEATPIFLITLDTTRRDALSPYHGRAEWTPNLDAFARQATVYDNAYSTAPWTLPSHASMMTGLFPSHHGAGVSEQFLPGSLPTLAGLLRRSGYFTAGFAGGNLCAHLYGVGQGFARYRNPDSFETTGDQLTNYLVSFLDQHHRRPLFVFANYFDPHALYHAPEAYQASFELDRHRAALEGHPLWQAFDRGSAGAWKRIIDGEAPAPPQVLDYMWAGYRSEVAFMDAQLGRLFENLKRYGLFDRALIVLVADHGELLGEGGLFSHAGRLDPELTEIPLIVKWPHQTEGRRISALVSQVDLFPTLLEAAGFDTASIPASDGRPLPRQQESPRERLVFLEEHESRVHPLPPTLTLGPHVYGLQRLLERQIVWAGGGECASRPPQQVPGGPWQPQPCQDDPKAVLAAVERRLGPQEEVENAGVLSKEQEEGLRALGYL